jgi:hypothetical protein
MKQSVGLRYYAIIATESVASRRFGDALSQAGWSLRGPATAQHVLPPEISLAVHDGDDAAWAAVPGDMLRITLGAGPDAPGDAALTGQETDEALAALFGQWLPPNHDQLERMATAFGRESLAPLVVSLRDELRAAVDALADGQPCDAHKLSGLTGTIGFAAASAAWRRQEEAGDALDDARRTTRTAIVAINRWLAG